MDEQSIINEIKHYVEKNILAPSVTIDADTDLKSAGIDSFSTVEILLFIERKYGTAIPDDPQPGTVVAFYIKSRK